MIGQGRMRGFYSHEGEQIARLQQRVLTGGEEMKKVVRKQVTRFPEVQTFFNDC